MYSTFETEIKIRPDDIDMNNHVHNSKYFDYVLAARYQQMKKNYKMSMEEFYERGYTWVVSKATVEYKRALLLTDEIIVKTQLASFSGAQSTVNFWIVKKNNNKVAAEGQFVYTMISISSGRPVKIPGDIVEKYTI